MPFILIYILLPFLIVGFIKCAENDNCVLVYVLIHLGGLMVNVIYEKIKQKKNKN